MSKSDQHKLQYAVDTSSAPLEGEGQIELDALVVKVRSGVTCVFGNVFRLLRRRFIG